MESAEVEHDIRVFSRPCKGGGINGGTGIIADGGVGTLAPIHETVKTHRRGRPAKSSVELHGPGMGKPGDPDVGTRWPDLAEMVADRFPEHDE